MDWDRVSINIFEGQAFSYVAWLDKAHGLHESAKLLEPRIQKFWDVLQGQQAMLSTPAEPEHIHATYFMLAAYSCENLLKAALIMRNVVRYKDEFQQTKRFPKDLQSHDLFKLAQKAGVALTASEEGILRRLTRSAVWSGRYPVPIKYGDVAGREVFSDGEDRSVSWFARDDLKKINSLMETLPERLGFPEWSVLSLRT